MTTGIFVICLLLAGLTAAFCRWKLMWWSALLIGIASAFSIFHATSNIALMIVWVILAPTVLILNVPVLRSQILTKWILKKFKERIPRLTESEMTALKAGDVWWEKELFCGNPNWQQLFSYPHNTLTAQEQQFLDHQVEELCAMLNDWQINEDKDLPEAVWEYIHREKFFGMIIGTEYGGLGFSALAHSTVIQKIASRSYSTAVNIMVPNSLGPAEFIIHYGTEEQKQHYLPLLASGQETPCFALTSPTAGSDAASIIDTGIICQGEYQGKKTIGLRLNWNKRYITLAPRATLMGIAVKVYDPDSYLEHKEDLGITFCLVPTHLPGVSNGKRHRPLNTAFVNGPTLGEDVFIPLDNIIGGPSMIGKGWEMMMASLSVGRAISLPAVSCGTAKLCYAVTSAYASVREQFNVAIGQFEGVQEALARMAGFTYICEATRLFSLTAADSGIKPSIASAISKYHLTELNRTIVNDAIDIHGGRAIMMGEKNYLGQYYFSVPINITVEGANILTRNLIIFGQGAMRCHPYAAEEMVAASQADQKTGLANFDHLIFEHLGWFASNFVRALFYSVTGGHLIPAPNVKNRYYLRQITRFSTALALVSDVAMMVLGGELKRKERLSARLGDVLSYLYMASAVLKFYHDNDESADEKIFADCALRCCLSRAQSALYAFLNNFKPRSLGWLLKRTIFLWGAPMGEPSDDDCGAILDAMLDDSEFRKRLLHNSYRSSDPDDPVNQLLEAFTLVKATESAYNKFKAARRAGKLKMGPDMEDQLESAINIGVITSDEADAITRMQALQHAVIQVDAF